MSFITLLQRAFAGGELAPALALRADLAKYASGLRGCRNFVVRREGGVSNRSGTRVVAETKYSGSSDARLKPYIFPAADESYLIECGDLYFRFYKNGVLVRVTGVAAYNGATAYGQGDLVVNAGVNYYAKQATTGNAPPNATYWYPLSSDIYELPTPYASGQFKPPSPACFSQSGDVITITHTNTVPMELRRYSKTRWTLTTIVTMPPIAAPTNIGFTPGTPAPVPAPNGLYTGYVVTAVDANGKESVASAAVGQDKVGVATGANPNTVTWTASAGAASYNVYKDVTGDGIFGFAFSVAASPFSDYGFTPNVNLVPPVARALFDATNRYPGVSATYQQRRIFACTSNDPEVVEASQVDTPSGFGIHTPIQDDDSVSFSLAGPGVHPVVHLVPLDRLVMLTDAGEWVLEGDVQGALTPTTINPRQHGYVGSSFPPPVVIGSAVLFVQARGRIMRDLRFTGAQEGRSLLSGRDLGVYAAHLFKYAGITDLAFAPNPHSIVWAVRADGVLLGLTYLPEEDVWGWHRHDTLNGVFESVCVLPEGDEDVVYVIVKRTIGTATRRFVERFASREYADIVDACFVDAAVVYDGAPATSITGLGHLEGQIVSVLADGAVPTPATYRVSGGTITLATAASVVQVGLPITADLETLDLDVQGSTLRARQKRVVNLALVLEASAAGFQVGPDYGHLNAFTAEAWQGTNGLLTEQVDVNPTTAYTNAGRMVLRHTAPTPLTVLGILPTLDVGG